MDGVVGKSRERRMSTIKQTLHLIRSCEFANAGKDVSGLIASQQRSSSNLVPSRSPAELSFVHTGSSDVLQREFLQAPACGSSVRSQPPVQGLRLRILSPRLRACLSELNTRTTNVRNSSGRPKPLSESEKLWGESIELPLYHRFGNEVSLARSHSGLRRYRRPT